MSEELVLATANLYTFVEASESLANGQNPQSRLDSWRTRANELSERLGELREQAGHEISSTLTAAVADLRAIASAIDQGAHDELRQRWSSLGVHYEAMLSHVERMRVTAPSSVYLGHVKPRNYTRNLFHVSNGLIGVLAYELVLSRWTLVAIGSTVVGAFLLMDTVRRLYPPFNVWFMDVIFNRIARPIDAHRTPSAIWYALAITVGTAIYPQRAIELGVLVLAFADPAAALGGKAWGRTKLYRDKTAAGVATFWLVALAVSVAFLFWSQPSWDLVAVLGVAALVATASALTELFSERINDNLTIPLVAGGIAALLL